MKRGAFNVLYGGQAGSEAKGKMSAFLVDKFDIKVVAGNLSPNAGHTVIKDGKKIVTHHIPVGVAGSKDIANVKVILGPASVINPELLMKELERLESWGFNRENLFIDSRATIITQSHIRTEEGTMTKIGSTAQGVGEARVDRLMRRGILAKSIPEFGCTYDTTELIHAFLSKGGTILYEMGQGFDLCLEHGVDPIYCTSRNCTPMQALADMGVPAKFLGDVYAVIRPYPIRVNNRDGSSGPYPSKEITWEEVKRRCGAPEEVDITELTTTTKLKRRVFEFSWPQIQRMVDVCDPTYFCLQFANYIDWKQYGRRVWENWEHSEMDDKLVEFIEKLIKYKPVGYIGTGPNHEDMIDMGIDQ